MHRNPPPLHGRSALAATVLAVSLVGAPLGVSAAAVDFGPRAPVAALPVPDAPVPGAVIDPVLSPGNGSPIHFGAGSASDLALAERVAVAIADDPVLEGATVTISAHNGRVSLSGSAESLEQSARAEQRAREVAGRGAVSGTLDPQGG